MTDPRPRGMLWFSEDLCQYLQGSMFVRISREPANRATFAPVSSCQPLRIYILDNTAGTSVCRARRARKTRQDSTNSKPFESPLLNPLITTILPPSGKRPRADPIRVEGEMWSPETATMAHGPATTHVQVRNPPVLVGPACGLVTSRDAALAAWACSVARAR